MTTLGRRLVQAAQGFYDRDANLALLRLYNFEAELVHVQTVANVLIMALMQLPEADFTMLLHLIPENIQVSVYVKKLQYGILDPALHAAWHHSNCLSRDNEQAEPLIGAVISLDRHLEGFRFAQFWSEVDRLRDILNPSTQHKTRTADVTKSCLLLAGAVLWWL
jgi:CSN8/PSMD8/EIF3K family